MLLRVRTFITKVKSALAVTTTEDYTRAAGFVAVLGVTLFLYATGKPIPDGLQVLLSAFMGFYVGRTSVNSGTNSSAASAQVG